MILWVTVALGIVQVGALVPFVVRSGQSEALSAKAAEAEACAIMAEDGLVEVEKFREKDELGHAMDWLRLVEEQ